MSISEEIEELKSQIVNGIQTNQRGQVMQLLKKAFALCESLKATLQASSLEERKALAESLQNFRIFLREEAEKLSKKSGMTEDEMLRYNENPDNFSKEQWGAMQEIRKVFSKQRKEIRNIVKESPAEGDKKPAKKKRPRSGRKIVTKSNWTKS